MSCEIHASMTVKLSPPPPLVPRRKLAPAPACNPIGASIQNEPKQWKASSKSEGEQPWSKRISDEMHSHKIQASSTLQMLPPPLPKVAPAVGYSPVGASIENGAFLRAPVQQVVSMRSEVDSCGQMWSKSSSKEKPSENCKVMMSYPKSLRTMAPSVPKRAISVDSDNGSVASEHSPPKKMKPSPPSRPPTIAEVRQHHVQKCLGRWQWAHNGKEPNGYMVLNHSGFLETN